MTATTSAFAWPMTTTLESLAERLREGPFRTIFTLHVRMCAAARAADPAELEKLVELLQLARMGSAQLRDLTSELESQIDHLAAARANPP